MTLVSVLGANAVVHIGSAGATDITDWVASIDLGDSYNANDVTTLGHFVTVEDPGLESFDIKLNFIWDGALDAIMRAEKGVKGHHLIVDPAGIGTGTPHLDYTGWTGDWNVSVSGPGDANSADSTFKARALTATINS